MVYHSFFRSCVSGGLVTCRSLANMAEDILATKHGSCGVICLNNPSKLNALNLSMIEKISKNLVRMEADESVRCILVKSNSPKAFCAGGDVQAVTSSVKNKGKYYKQFFFHEYIMNYAIATCTKPYVALVHGITMGGGVGLSVHGRFRVATETSLFAMPETAIGLFPDVGGGHFLSRLPGALGTYLALTGHRLKGPDLLHAGIATHYVNSSMLPSLEQELMTLPTDTSGSEQFDEVEKVLNHFHQKNSTESKGHEQFSLQDKLKTIDAIFGESRVEQVMRNLESDGSEWSQKTLNLLHKFSPRALKLTIQQLKVAKNLPLEENLKLDYRLAMGCCELDGDFVEGVRALLIDKDGSPKWDPASLDKVTNSHIEKFFRPLHEDLDVKLGRSKIEP